jgi:hypothetical protein
MENRYTGLHRLFPKKNSRLIHEKNIERTRNIAKMEIQEAIAKYEPRAEILDITTFADGNLKDEAIVILKVLYVEFNEEEIIEYRIEHNESWENEEGIKPDPIQDMFSEGFKYNT